MKPSTRLITHAVALALNVLAAFLGAITRDYLITGLALIFVFLSINQIVKAGNELDSFYQAYSDEDKKEEEDK